MSATKFRLFAKNIFLTYSQCPVPLSVASLLIRGLFGERLEYGLVCSEQHAVEGSHLHVFIVLVKRWDIKNPRTLDFVHGGITYHPKMEVARSVYQSIKYVCKDGNVVGLNCDWKTMLQAAKKKTSTKVALIASLIMSGKTLIEINEKYPGFVCQHLKVLQSYKNWLDLKHFLQTPLLTFQGVQHVDKEEPRHWENQVIRWINMNFWNNPTRHHKQRQLWIHGRTNTGKTHLIMTLMSYFHAYEIPDDNNWYDGYSDSYDWAYMDEFKGCKKIQWLNSFAEGRQMSLNVRGKQPTLKTKNLPLVIACNYSIRDCFSKADYVVVEALQKRFLEVEVPLGDRLDINFEFDSSDEDTLECYSSDEEGCCPPLVMEN